MSVVRPSSLGKNQRRGHLVTKHSSAVSLAVGRFFWGGGGEFLIITLAIRSRAGGPKASDPRDTAELRGNGHLRAQRQRSTSNTPTPRHAFTSTHGTGLRKRPAASWQNRTQDIESCTHPAQNAKHDPVASPGTPQALGRQGRAMAILAMQAARSSKGIDPGHGLPRICNLTFGPREL